MSCPQWIKSFGWYCATCTAGLVIGLALSAGLFSAAYLILWAVAQVRAWLG